MPIIETKGAASSQGFGQFASTGEAVYIESVFQTWLYTGNGSTQTITNGIDLSTKGGLVWIKSRSAGYGHYIFDTNRGALNRLASNGTGAESSISNSLTSFLSNGFSLGSEIGVNESPGNYASWTFRKQPKFFDVVTYTGTGSLRTVAHSLGSVPGTIIVKCTSEARSWFVYHRSLGENKYLTLETTNAEATDAGSGGVWGGTAPTATEFTVGATAQTNGGSGRTYVAYLFAHDAGGFGLTGTDNVISCGSFTTDGSGNATVTLGYEPQWTLIKRSDSSTGGNWRINDNMRNMVAAPNLGDQLFPNLSSAESIGNGVAQPTATGFTTNNGALNASATYIYIAIRRGPMKTPTTGTSVYTPQAATKSGAVTVTAGFPVDLTIEASRTQSFVDGLNSSAIDRLRGGDRVLITSGTASEYGSGGCSFASNTTFTDGWLNDNPNIYWMFRRAPGFFDVVCYTGTGSATTQAHNLGVVPEMMIVKVRTGGTVGWVVYHVFTGASQFLVLNNTDAASGAFQQWNSTAPTSTVFSLSGGGANSNINTYTYVAYLFASVAGVSKVGSYTGTGALQTINCGFTGGARFVLIKRTDSTGDWWVYDSARGITSGNDPYLFLNSTAAEVTGTNYVDTASTGFQVTAAAPAGLNANGGSYIFLAVA